MNLLAESCVARSLKAKNLQSDSTGQLQQSILTVNESNEPFSAQIATVCGILGLNIDVQWTDLLEAGGEVLPYHYNASDPRPEWALRWLLKKLQPGEVQLGSPCLLFRSWLLLRASVVRTHPAKTAGMLKEHNFIGVICKTIHWLYENHDKELLHQSSEDDESLKSSDEGSVQASRKRKRDGTEETQEIVKTATGALDAVLLALCAVIGQLEALARDSEHIGGFTSEYVKSALRSPLEEAARILGGALYLTNHLLQEPNRNSEPMRPAKFEAVKRLQNTAYRFCVSNVIGLWNARAVARRDSIETDSTYIFRIHCMLPTLQLLHTCREWSSPEKVMEAVTTSLEDLLITHIILPFRTSLVGTENPVQLPVVNSASFLNEDLVSALKSYHFPRPKSGASLGKGVYEVQKQALETETHLKISFISLLFDIALDLYPRNESNNSMGEEHWLEELFIQLTDCAAMLLPPISPVKPHKDYARLLRWMLQKSVDHNLQLSLSKIQAILEQVSGLFSSDSDDPIEWSVISLCIHNYANAFVVPDTTGKTYVSHSSHPSNDYLSTLLSKIADEHFQAGQDYDYLLSEVMLPLCSAFADARDLGTFIRHWTEQICIDEHRQTIQGRRSRNSPCLWQDERLLHSVAQLAESKLTPSQIDRLLSSAAEKLTPSKPEAREDSSLFLASLVTLDCLFASVSQEETLDKLAETAQSIFSSLDKLLSDGNHFPGDSNRSREHKWRIWRIKTTIADRWVKLHSSPTFRSSVQSVVYTASEVLGRLSSETSPDGEVDWSEELFTFRFLLHFTVIEASGISLHFPIRTRLKSAMEKILDVMEPFCHRVSHDHFQTTKLPAYFPKWGAPNIEFSSLDALYVGCVADILLSPVALNCLDVEIQKRLIGQLYWCAVYQQRLSGSMPSGSIDYSWPWKMLLGSDILSESASTKGLIRNFLVDHYLKISDFDDSKYWDTGAADYLLAFSNILRIPVHALERHQRSLLSNRILRILLDAKISSFATANDHLTMLTKLAGYPNKSMNLFTDWNERSRKEGAQSSEDGALVGLASVIHGITPWSDEKVESVIALRRLTRLITSYLFSTINQTSSIEYLQILYNRLAESLERISRKQRSYSDCLTAMAEELLSAYAKHRGGYPDSLRPIMQSLDVTRLYHFEIILRQLGKISTQWDLQGAYSLKTPHQRHKLGVNLECLAGYSELLAIHPALREISLDLFSTSGLTISLRQVLSALDYGDTYWLEKEICGCEYLATRLAKVELMLDARDSKLHPGISEATRRVQDVKSTKERHNLLVSVREMIPSLGLQNKKQLCFEYDMDHSRCLNYSEIYLVGLALDDLKEQEVEELRKSISRTFTLLCRCLFEPVVFRDSMLAMQCMSMVMQKQPRVITQLHIDNLLSGVQAKSSYTEDRSNKKDSAMLYIGLCRIFGTILTVHRTRISGRYHLVILALQSLLRCLFVPYKTAQSTIDTKSFFNETHAAAYARLLTNLCDPTVSSVTRSKHRSRLELNDETKKAKDVAGQHLLYLVMEYCNCQLKGRLLPEMKTALNAGLYTVLAVMSQDVMRTMNAAMDESPRAVWKALYEDYRRFGQAGGV